MYRKYTSLHFETIGRDPAYILAMYLQENLRTIKKIISSLNPEKGGCSEVKLWAGNFTSAFETKYDIFLQNFLSAVKLHPTKEKAINLLYK